MATPPTYSPGLEGVIAGETALSFVNPERSSLMYRGYDIRDLAEKSTYEEVAYMLLHGRLPRQNEYDQFCDQLKKGREPRKEVLDFMRLFPANGNIMDLVRSAVSIMALYDIDVTDNARLANLRKAIRLTAVFPTLVAYSYRVTRGLSLIAPDPALGHGANFLYMLTGDRPDANTEKIFDITLIAYADHGFNASTFAARVTASTLADMHAAVVAAIGALKGPLHGGANEEAMKMLLDIGAPENAEQYILNALAHRQKIMGFGHRAYKSGDPRATLLFNLAKQLCDQKGQELWHQIATVVRDTMHREKNIFANVDFPTAYLYYVMGLPMEIYTPIFALARVAGWTAHVIEQHDHNRLIRPSVIYNGPLHLDYPLMDERNTAPASAMAIPSA